MFHTTGIFTNRNSVPGYKFPVEQTKYKQKNLEITPMRIVCYLSFACLLLHACAPRIDEKQLPGAWGLTSAAPAEPEGSDNPSVNAETADRIKSLEERGMLLFIYGNQTFSDSIGNTPGQRGKWAFDDKSRQLKLSYLNGSELYFSVQECRGRTLVLEGIVESVPVRFRYLRQP